MAFIGLGSNLGDRCGHLEAALESLRTAPGVFSVRASSFHESEPVGGPAGQGPYLNGAARIETSLSAREVLDLLLSVEQGLGRERRERWGPRTIDLDLLLFDDQVIATPELVVPHPRMHERRFVLEPLAEVGGEVVHPVLGKTVRELLDEMRERGRA